MFSLLSLLDDIATTFDDVAVMSKAAMEKTTALMSDDLAVNAGVIDGVSPHRELPMVKSIFLGSLLNKVYCIIGVLVLMAIYPPIIKGILFIGGLYLSYEGAHKVLEKFFPHKDENIAPKKILTEKDKVKGAIKTDLILSIEIIVIAKGSIEGPILNQFVSLIVVGIAASILIYGLVGFLVKLDDLGLYLIEKNYQKLGSTLVRSMPYIMKGLGIVGTIAMFLVGGGIVSHTFHLSHFLPELIQNFFLGLLAGLIVVGIFSLIQKIKKQI